jgi:uncharacterized protein (DUF488 family)
VGNFVYTVGHSTWTFERFLSLLRPHAITVVADVRSQPHSRLNPQFNRDRIAKALQESGLRYVFLGKELGARVSDPSCYRDGKVQYELVAKTPIFARGIDRIRKGIETYRVALLCAEKEPLACHRTILIGRHLRGLNIAVRHILEDGSFEDHDASISRLVKMLRIPEADMFMTRDDVVSRAYAMQAERIAFSRDTISRPA